MESIDFNIAVIVIGIVEICCFSLLLSSYCASKICHCLSVYVSTAESESNVLPASCRYSINISPTTTSVYYKQITCGYIAIKLMILVLSV